MTDCIAVRYHPDVSRRDLPLIIAILGDGHTLQEFIAAMNSAISDVLTERNTSSRQLRYPLNGWFRKKFHSRTSPPMGANADARLIYRMADDGAGLLVLAVGLRRPGAPEDIYAQAGARLIHER